MPIFTLLNTGICLMRLKSKRMGLEAHYFQDVAEIRELAITLVGMANSKGGSIYIGINQDTGKIQGLRNPSQTMDQIYQAALIVNPPLILPTNRRKYT